MIQYIFLDFDGVILDSDAIKNAGFAHIFRNYPAQAVSTLMQFHQENGGVSRYEKIRFFYEQCLGESITDAQVDILAQEFSNFVSERLCDPNQLIQDTHEFIKKYSREFQIYVVSAADETELRWLCSTLEIAPFFKEILGSPGTKVEILGRAMEHSEATIHNGVMIGDSINDYQAAITHGIPFFGYNNTKLKELQEAYYLESFEDLYHQLLAIPG